MNGQELHIVLSSNERYMPGATVALAGIALNAKPETELVFHVFTEDVKRNTLQFLEAALKRLHARSVVVEHICDESILAGLPNYAGSRMCWVRCFYARILKDVDWALYVDCDVLYLASPEEHFSYAEDSVYACVVRDMSPDAPLEDKVWAARECGVELDIDHYFNSGVMLFNFKKFREDAIPERIADFIKAHSKTNYADQTAMNVLFNGKGIKLIPEKFDWLQIYLDDQALAQQPVIHYVSGIPWLPRRAVVANGRFRLWHAFADKYVWQKSGESYRRCFGWGHLVLKYVTYWLLITPGLSTLFGLFLTIVGKGRYFQSWRRAQVWHDVRQAIVV